MNKKMLSFCVYFVVLAVLATWPQPFAWSNRISPEILGLPFAIFWQFLIAALFSVGLITWYVLDARSGELDLDTETVVDEADTMSDSESTASENRSEAKEGGSR